MRLQHPIAGKTQQGAIFNCATAPGYQGCNCWGIVLTARCDLEHNKQTVINYLPIVTFRDWIVRHLALHLAKRTLKDLGKDLANALQARGVSEQIRDTFPIEDIIQRETKGKERTVLLEKAATLALAKEMLQPGTLASDNAAKALVSKSGKKSEALIQELIEQKLAEFYFLESVDCQAKVGEGFVVLLRHMSTMDTCIMQHIVQGLTPKVAKKLSRSDQHLSFAHEPICMVVGVLRSPDLEHLSQQFAHLFTRIGLEDHRQETFDTHIHLCHTLTSL